jgi:xanthine dehydrogenase/oxidase
VQRRREGDDQLDNNEIGEPPLVLAASVSFAVKYAVRALRVERGLAGLFRLDAPTTVRDVRRACAIPGTEMASTPA